MKVKIVKAVALILAMLCILCFPIPVSAVSQGTDGTELQVMKPQNLQIHLGEDWAGIGFELTTDAGKYPGIIPVGEDGVLRLEIGGSENYILNCLNSTVATPAPNESFPAGTEMSSEAESGNDSPNMNKESASSTEETVPAEASTEHTIAGIPITHLTLFVGGLIVAAGTLTGIHISQKRRVAHVDYDENDEF